MTPLEIFPSDTILFHFCRKYWANYWKVRLCIQTYPGGERAKVWLITHRICKHTHPATHLTHAYMCMQTHKHTQRHAHKHLHRQTYMHTHSAFVNTEAQWPCLVMISHTCKICNHYELECVLFWGLRIHSRGKQQQKHQVDIVDIPEGEDRDVLDLWWHSEQVVLDLDSGITFILWVKLVMICSFRGNGRLLKHKGAIWIVTFPYFQLKCDSLNVQQCRRLVLVAQWGPALHWMGILREGK